MKQNYKGIKPAHEAKIIVELSGNCADKRYIEILDTLKQMQGNSSMKMKLRPDLIFADLTEVGELSTPAIIDPVPSDAHPHTAQLPSDKTDEYAKLLNITPEEIEHLAKDGNIRIIDVEDYDVFYGDYYENEDNENA